MFSVYGNAKALQDIVSEIARVDDTEAGILEQGQACSYWPKDWPMNAACTIAR
jgi:hypothetical protein